MTASFQAPPPVQHNREAEQGLLSVLLMHDRAFDDVTDILRPEHFADGAHGRIYEAAMTLRDRGQNANPITLKAIADQDSTLAEVGGSRYLAELVSVSMSPRQARSYALTIRDLYLRRRLEDVAEQLMADARIEDLDRSPLQIATGAEERLQDLVLIPGTSGLEPLSASLAKTIATTERAYQTGGQITGLTTGLLDLDAALGGLHPGRLTVIAARPAMGKTGLAGTIAYAAAVAGATVGIWELEMSDEDLSRRFLATVSGIDVGRQISGNIDTTEFHRLIDAGQDLDKLPIHIDSTEGISISLIRQRARRLKRKHGLGLIVIDYLQLMSKGEKTESRRLELEEISRKAKGLAKELEVPVILLSQLSRGPEGRDDKRPQLSDLRETGAIEQDADQVIMIYRDEYYAERAAPQRGPSEGDEAFARREAAWMARLDASKNIAELIIVKNRHGQTKTIRCRFDGARSLFQDLAHWEVL